MSKIIFQHFVTRNYIRCGGQLRQVPQTVPGALVEALIVRAADVRHHPDPVSHARVLRRVRSRVGWRLPDFQHGHAVPLRAAGTQEQDKGQTRGGQARFLINRQTPMSRNTPSRISMTTAAVVHSTFISVPSVADRRSTYRNAAGRHSAFKLFCSYAYH